MLWRVSVGLFRLYSRRKEEIIFPGWQDRRGEWSPDSETQAKPNPRSPPKFNHVQVLPGGWWLRVWRAWKVSILNSGCTSLLESVPSLCLSHYYQVDNTWNPCKDRNLRGRAFPAHHLARQLDPSAQPLRIISGWVVVGALGRVPWNRANSFSATFLHRGPVFTSTWVLSIMYHLLCLHHVPDTVLRISSGPSH